MFARFAQTDAKVLDAGAGTGQVGAALAKLGFTHLTGMDLSSGMLDIARATGVYEALSREEMGTRLSFATDAFDAAICVATLTIGHAPTSSLDEIVRVVKPGGKIVFTMRPDHYESGGSKEKQTEIEQSGRWKVVERGDRFYPMAGEPDMEYEIWVYEVTT